jgi:hypothetical protein
MGRFENEFREKIDSDVRCSLFDMINSFPSPNPSLACILQEMKMLRGGVNFNRFLSSNDITPLRGSGLGVVLVSNDISPLRGSLGLCILSVRNQVRYVKCEVRKPGSGIRDLVSGIWHPASGIRDPASGIRHHFSANSNSSFCFTTVLSLTESTYFGFEGSLMPFREPKTSAMETISCVLSALKFLSVEV